MQLKSARNTILCRFISKACEKASLFSSLDSWGTPLISLMLTSSRPWCPGAWKCLFTMSIDEIILVLVETRTKMILSIHNHSPGDHHWPPVGQRWSHILFSQEVVFGRNFFSSFFVFFFRDLKEWILKQRELVNELGNWPWSSPTLPPICSLTNFYCPITQGQFFLLLWQSWKLSKIQRKSSTFQ